MSYTRKAVHGAGAILIMSLIASLFGYLTRIVLARSLSPEDFGLFYSVLTFVIFFVFFRDLGFPQALFKYISEFKVQQRYNAIKTIIISVFSLQLLSSLVLSVLFFVLAPHLAAVYFKNPQAAPLLRGFTVYVFCSIFFIITKDTLLGLQQIKLFALGEPLKNGIILFLSVWLLHTGLGIKAPLLAFVLVMPILFIIFFPLLLRHFPFFQHQVEQFWPISKQALWFAAPVFATAMGSKVIGYIDTLILTYFRSLTEVGIYNVVLPSALVLLYLGTAIGSAAFPLVSELWVKKDLKKLEEGLRLTYRYIFVLSIPFLASTFYFGQFILIEFFGQPYGIGATALKILLFGVLGYSLAVINHNILSAIGKPKIVTVIVFISAILNAGFNLMLIPRFGINGAAVSTTISYLFALAASLYATKKYFKNTPPYLDWMKLGVLAVLFVFLLAGITLLLHFPPWIELIISVLCASIIYLGLVIALHLINIIEIKRYYHLIRWKEQKS